MSRANSPATSNGRPPASGDWVRGARVEVALPSGRVDEVELLIMPTFLPFLKIVDLEMTFDDADADADPERE